MSANEKALNKIWKDICTHGGQSLCVDRGCPHSPSKVLRENFELDEEKLEFVCGMFIGLTNAMRLHFPENIFWDLDALVYSTVWAAQRESSFEESMRMRTETMEKLMEVFGIQGEICFQYLHDFTYGFDWLKWHQKAQPINVDVKDSFSPDFMSYMLDRGQQMTEMIQSDRGKYRPIEPGTFRNSYPFKRDPISEKNGLIKLRDQKAIPLNIWDARAEIRHDLDYLQIREEKLCS